jgi:uncharacterized protein (DUF1810 family)
MPHETARRHRSHRVAAFALGDEPAGVTDPHGLQRFVDAQSQTYAQALSELRSAHKRTHWMWFVFPQIAGLGRSGMAQRFAISGLEEARAYLAHPLLGRRLVESARALTDLDTADAEQVFGPVDAQKLQSSMTLFARAAPDEPVFREVLDHFFDGAEDAGTTSRL